MARAELEQRRQRGRGRQQTVIVVRRCLSWYAWCYSAHRRANAVDPRKVLRRINWHSKEDEHTVCAVLAALAYVGWWLLRDDLSPHQESELKSKIDISISALHANHRQKEVQLRRVKLETPVRRQGLPQPLLGAHCRYRHFPPSAIPYKVTHRSTQSATHENPCPGAAAQHVEWRRSHLASEDR